MPKTIRLVLQSIVVMGVRLVLRVVWFFDQFAWLLFRFLCFANRLLVQFARVWHKIDARRGTAPFIGGSRERGNTGNVAD
jgi:hypothetical protein